LKEEKKTVKISNTIVAAISLIVIMIAMLATIGIVVDQVESAVAEAVNWTFTGHEGAEALLGLIPFAWIAGIAVMGIAGSFLLVQGLRGKED
jgi:heme/copper-type cytochrome/quinol oxidase subunit 2